MSAEFANLVLNRTAWTKRLDVYSVRPRTYTHARATCRTATRRGAMYLHADGVAGMRSKPIRFQSVESENPFGVHSRAHARSRDFVPSTDGTSRFSYALATKLGVSLRGRLRLASRVASRRIASYLLFIFMLDSNATSYVVRLLRRRRPRRQQIVQRRLARHAASHSRGLAWATPRRFTASFVDTSHHPRHPRQLAAGHRFVRHGALLRHVESH